MTPEVFRSALDGGSVMVSAWVSSDSAYAAEVLSHVGYDAVTIDCQHGMFDRGDAVALLQAVAAGPALPMARVDQLDRAAIGKLLDGGAWGIVCPTVETVEQCRAFVDACRYPPDGTRSHGPARGLLVGGPEYAAKANELVMTWASIESPGAAEQLDRMVDVAGLDGIYVGPSDMALAMGETPGVPFSDRLVEMISNIATVVRQAGLAAGIFCPEPSLAEPLVNMGYNLITPGNDMHLLKAAAQRNIDAVPR